MTLGTTIDVGRAISRATNLLVANPWIILVQAIPAIPSLVSDVYSGPSALGLFAIVASLLSAILSLIASGAYPPIVDEAVKGRRITIGDALGRAYNRFWSLLGAGVLVVIIVFLGLIAFVVPGIIFATWYAYTTPAIMLENKGALSGMAASKAFGRDKKASTFAILLIFFLVYIIVSAFGALLSLGGGGRVIETLLTIPLSAWTSVVIAYVYVVHGPARGSPEPSQPAWQPPAGVGEPMGVAAAPEQGASRFCTSCGSALAPGAKFCSNCGRPV